MHLKGECVLDKKYDLDNDSAVRGTKSIRRALAVLDLLADHPPGLTLTEVSNKTNIPKSTTHRILSVLKNHTYVRLNSSTDLYMIGHRAVLQSQAYMESFNFREEIRPYLKRLNKQLDETVHLGVLDDDGKKVIYIDKLDSSRAVRMFSRIGQSVPIHCTALGKSMVSCLSKETLQTILEGYDFRQFTDNTITNKRNFLKEIDIVQERGFAIDNHEHEENVMCVGKAICNQLGEVIAAVSVSIPVQRMNKYSLDDLVKAVIDTTDRISQKVRHLSAQDLLS